MTATLLIASKDGARMTSWEIRSFAFDWQSPSFFISTFSFAFIVTGCNEPEEVKNGTASVIVLLVGTVQELVPFFELK